VVGTKRTLLLLSLNNGRRPFGTTGGRSMRSSSVATVVVMVVSIGLLLFRRKKTFR
jgi:LPXTG-motif cell wall-anchored protein